MNFYFLVDISLGTLLRVEGYENITLTMGWNGCVRIIFNLYTTTRSFQVAKD